MTGTTAVRPGQSGCPGQRSRHSQVRSTFPLKVLPRRSQLPAELADPARRDPESIGGLLGRFASGQRRRDLAIALGKRLQPGREVDPADRDFAGRRAAILMPVVEGKRPCAQEDNARPRTTFVFGSRSADSHQFIINTAATTAPTVTVTTITNRISANDAHGRSVECPSRDTASANDVPGGSVECLLRDMSTCRGPSGDWHSQA